VATQQPGLWHERRGTGAPVLLLLHGLGATGEVWRGAFELAAGWPGSRVLVDLPGHGRSGRLADYSFQAHALALRALLGANPGPVVIAGHSMGGFIGILLSAERFGLEVAAVLGLGIKVRWSDDEVQGMRRRAGQPVRWFDTREEAAARYLRSVGLDGLAEEAGALASSGIAEVDGRWRLAFDPAANGVGQPDMARTLAGARAPVTLARGSDDHMVSAGDLQALDRDALELPGLSHNAHVEDPAAVWRLISEVARQAGVRAGTANGSRPSRGGR
jgi:pimeloyl-ACP methyl ester carboxylesterase